MKKISYIPLIIAILCFHISSTNAFSLADFLASIFAGRGYNPTVIQSANYASANTQSTSQGFADSRTTTPGSPLQQILQDLGQKNNALIPLASLITPTTPNNSTPLSQPPQSEQPYEPNIYLDRPATVQDIQKFFGLKTDGIYGPKTEAQVRDYQRNLGLEPTGKLDEATQASLNQNVPAYQNYQNLLKDPQNDPGNTGNTSNADGNYIGGSGKGGELGFSQGSNFCTDVNGNNSEGSNFASCGSSIGNCKNIPKTFVNKETEKIIKESCEKCPDCNYTKGSCGTPLYFFRGNNKNNAVPEANKPLCALALKQSKLVEIFGSSKHSSYCGKKLFVCASNGKCGNFPVLDTGLSFEKRIDMTGCVDRVLGISDKGLNQIISARLQDDSSSGKTQVADLPKAQ
jgi:peptidoglycan hydrolase-like protein with peptidoglycan-binding domain